MGKPLKMDIVFYRPSWRAKNGNIKRWDVDSHLKALIDSSLTCLGLDDSAILDLTAKKLESPEAERTFVRLTFLETT